MNVTTVLDSVVALLIILLVGMIVLAITRASRGRPVKGISTAVVAVAVAAIVLGSISAGLVFIQPEERGVVISAVAPKGYREEALQPGLSWIIPFLESVRTYPISRQTYTMSRAAAEGDVAGDDSIQARTSDGQVVYVDASVIYAIDPAQVVNVHIEWQGRYTDELVRPTSRGIIRDVVSQYGIEEVYSSKRDELTGMLTKILSEKFNENGLTMIDFVMRDISFSPEYAASVEQKQIAEQQAEQARFVVEQRKQEAEQARQVAQGQADAAVIRARGEADARLIQAQAEAQALERLSQALEDQPELLQYNFINRIAPGVQTVFLPNDVPYLFPMPTTGASTVPGLNLAPTPAPTPLPIPTPLPTPTP